jgi:hypothetical protein
VFKQIAQALVGSQHPGLAFAGFAAKYSTMIQNLQALA